MQLQDLVDGKTRTFSPALIAGALRTTKAEIVPASHALADRLVAAGFAGMRVPSFAAGAGPDDVNLVLWRWSGRRPSRVVLIDDEGRLTKMRRSGP